MTDEDFMASLEAGRLPAALFNHSAHVRAGFLYLRRCRFPQAVARMCATVENFAITIGKPDRYHETITVAFLALIFDHLRRRGDGGGWDGFQQQNPELLRTDALLAYYPQAVLDSAAARTGFVLMPIPT